MLPLYEDPHFTFRFDTDRLVPRFHLPGVPAGRRISVYRTGPDGRRVGPVAAATTGPDGWVDLPGPIVVRAGEGFDAVPEPDGPAGFASPPCEAPPGYWGEDDPPPQP